MKAKITITISKELLKIFKQEGENQGYKISTKIEALIRNFLKKEEK